MATVQLQIGPTDRGRRMTLDEFRAADTVEGYCYELARGMVEVTEVPDDPHGLIVSNAQAMWHLHKRTHPGTIWRIGGGNEFRLWVEGMDSGRTPDLGLVLHGTPRDARGRRPPSLIAEVVSKRAEARDYVVKREEYWVFGAREYWIIDPHLRQVLVLIRRDLAWEERTFAGDARIDSELLPGFAGTVAELWADLDE